MVNIKTEISIEDFADALADGDADQQSKFFNVFFKALKMGCGTAYKFDMQKTYIAEKLDSNAKESVEFLGWKED